jgi:hypothetical protein
LDILYFYQIVAAVIAGNTLTAWFIHSLWRVTKVEKTGLDASHAPWGALIGCAAPPLIAAAALYFVTV